MRSLGMIRSYNTGPTHSVCRHGRRRRGFPRGSPSCVLLAAFVPPYHVQHSTIPPVRMIAGATPLRRLFGTAFPETIVVVVGYLFLRRSPVDLTSIISQERGAIARPGPAVRIPTAYPRWAGFAALR